MNSDPVIIPYYGNKSYIYYGKITRSLSAKFSKAMYTGPAIKRNMGNAVLLPLQTYHPYSIYLFASSLNSKNLDGVIEKVSYHHFQ